MDDLLVIAQGEEHWVNTDRTRVGFSLAKTNPLSNGWAIIGQSCGNATTHIFVR